MNSSCGIGLRCISEDTTNMYFIATDEDGKLYAVINPNANLKKAWDWHIGLLPVDIIKASYEENALNAIDLQYKEEKICQFDNENKKVTRTLSR